MGRASRAFIANRFQLENGWITKAWGAARGSPCGRALVSAGAGRIQASGPGEATPAEQIPGARSQPQPGPPHPVSRVALKALSITEAAFICLLGDGGGQGDQDPHPRPCPPVAPCIPAEIFPGQSSQSLYPVFKV